MKVLNTSGLLILKSHYFYSTLLLARSVACILEFIKPKQVVKNEGVGAWKFGEHHVLTRVICAILNLDFAVLSALNRCAIRPPGLSLLAICQKK
jgi:hypothetical protein